MHDDLDFLTANLALAERQSLDVDDLRLMYRLEMSGETFYEHLANGVGNEEAAALFRSNGREERKHAERVLRAIGVKVGHDYTPEGSDLEPLRIDLPEQIPLEVLPLVVQGELNGNTGYQLWADNEPDPEVQRLLRLNGREETIHAGRVEAAIAILTEAANIG